MTYVIFYLLVGVLFASFIDMAGDVHFKIMEKIVLIMGWPYLLVVGLVEYLKH
jgi:hypothetical protein